MPDTVRSHNLNLGYQSETIAAGLAGFWCVDMLSRDDRRASLTDIYKGTILDAGSIRLERLRRLGLCQQDWESNFK